MAQPKSSSKSKSTKSKKVVKATGEKKVSRAVSAKSAKIDLAPAVVVPEPVIAAVTAEAVVEAPVLVAAEVVEQAPTRSVTRAEFMDMVRKEAYRRAALRNFRNGSPFQDWVNAEAAVSGKLAAEGARLS